MHNGSLSNQSLLKLPPCMATSKWTCSLMVKVTCKIQCEKDTIQKPPMRLHIRGGAPHSMENHVYTPDFISKALKKAISDIRKDPMNSSFMFVLLD